MAERPKFNLLAYVKIQLEGATITLELIVPFAKWPGFDLNQASEVQMRAPPIAKDIASLSLASALGIGAKPETIKE
jgi:hypothetical protein